MANYRHGKITEEVFNHVKFMLSLGNTNAETARVVKLSMGTVSNIRNANTFDEYKAIAYGHEREKKRIACEKQKKEQQDNTQAAPQEVVKEVRQNVTIQATHYMEEQLRKTNELLQQISAKLAYIVNDLYGTKEG